MSASAPRRLLVMRHAKAAGSPGIDDEHRPLTGRGRRDAAAAGQWLLTEGVIPDLVICSSARRTRQTWQHVSEAFGPGLRTRVAFETRAYYADESVLLDLVRDNAGAAAAVLVIGHNPASHRLALALTGRPELSFPTSAIAVIEIQEEWAALAPGDGELARLWSPPVAS